MSDEYFNEIYEKVKKNAESPPYLIYAGITMIGVCILWIGIGIGSMIK